MSTAPVAVVLEGFVDQPLRLTMAGTLLVYAQAAQEQHNPTSAGSILRQAAAITAQGGGVLELMAVTRADLGAVLDTITHSTEARKAELAAVLAEHRAPMDLWASALFRLWTRVMAAAAAMPPGSIPPMEEVGGMP